MKTLSPMMPGLLRVTIIVLYLLTLLYMNGNARLEDNNNSRQILNVKDYGAVGDGLTDDRDAIQRAILVADEGGAVYLPSGTYRVNSTLFLKSGVIIRGEGIDRTILFMPSKQSFTALLKGLSIKEVTISDLNLTSTAAKDLVFAIMLSDYSDVKIERVKVINCLYALKADTHGGNFTIRDFVVRDSGQIYISNLTNGLFENLDVEVLSELPEAVTNRQTFHALYLCSNNHHLQFNHTRWRGGTGVVMQLWHDTGLDTDDINFNDLDIEGNFPMAIGSGNYNLSIRNAKFSASSIGYPCIMLASPSGILIDGFIAGGGGYFLQNYGGNHVSRNVTIKNGKYTGETLIYDKGSWITNLVVEDVITGVVIDK